MQSANVRTRFYHSPGFSDGNRLILSLLGAFTRIEQHALGVRPKVFTWQQRYRDFHGPFECIEEDWTPYFNERTKSRGLKIRAASHNNWGNFIHAWLHGGALSAFPEASGPQLERLQEGLKFTTEGLKREHLDDPSKFLVRLQKLYAQNASNRMQDLFPNFAQRALPDTPGVTLLSPGSIEMALYDYLGVKPEQPLGVFLVVREPRPPYAKESDGGLYRDLIYIFDANPSPEDKDVRGCYISSFDREVYSLKSMQHPDWTRLRRPTAEVQSDQKQKTLDLYLGQVDHWKQQEAAIGILSGSTRKLRHPGIWKVLISKPNRWGSDLTDIEAMLDLVTLHGENKVDQTIQEELIQRLGPEGLGVIGPFPQGDPASDGVEDGNEAHVASVYKAARRDFASLTSFVTAEEAESYIDLLLEGIGARGRPDEQLDVTYEVLKDRLKRNWAHLEPSQYILATTQKKRIHFNLPDLANDNLFGRGALKRDEGVKLQSSDVNV